MTDLDELDAIASNWQRPEDILETERPQVEAVVLALPSLIQEVRAARAALAESGRLREALRDVLARIEAAYQPEVGWYVDPVYLRAARLVDAATPPAPSDHGASGERELREKLAAAEAWIAKRKAHMHASRDRYRAAHPEVHRKSARESMARTRARRRAAVPPEPASPEPT